MIDLLSRGRDNQGTTRTTRGVDETPVTQQTREAPGTVPHTRPTTVQPTEGVPTTTTTQADATKRNTQPATAGPLYGPGGGDPRHIV